MWHHPDGEAGPAEPEAENDSAAFGALLRQHRLAAGLTQEALAERAGLSQRGIQGLERGERHPYRDTVRRLLVALELPAEASAAFEAAGAPAPRPRRPPAGQGPARTGITYLPAARVARERAERPQPAGAAAPTQTLDGQDWPAGEALTLPLQLTSFVGREADLTELSTLLTGEAAGARLVTLTGPGGCGKTRLALEAAAALGAEYRDGARLVDLAALADPALVPQAVATALGVREEPNRPLAVTLRDALRPRHLLLVLDNCEHLRGACAVLATGLLQTCAALCILATSRQALGIAGEVVRQVSPLPVPPEAPLGEAYDRYPAVRLFADRAAAAAPGFALTPQNAPAVAEVCRRLDGLPLALELAAARARGLPVELLAARLDQRLRLLTTDNPAAPPRQRTLRATLDWSFDLLCPAEQTLFRRLAVFAGGLSLEAAETVCADPDTSARRRTAPLDSGAVLDGLVSLVDKSLVLVRPVPSGVPAARYWLLDTVRQYARERLVAAGEEEAFGRRHLEWCLGLAERAAAGLAGPEQVAWLDRLEQEHQNLRAALDWAWRADPAAGLALAGWLWPFWLMRAHHTEGRQRLTGLLAAAPAGASAGPVAGQRAGWGETSQRAGRAAALLGAGVLAITQRDHGAARTLLEESLGEATAGDDRAGAARAQCALGQVVAEQGDYQQARALLEASLAASRGAGDRTGAAEAVAALADLAATQGDFPRASALYAESSAEFRALGNPWRLARSLAHLARIHTQGLRAPDDYAQAAALYREGLAAWRALGDLDRVRWAVGQLGNLARLQGHYAEARAWLQECLHLATESGTSNGRAAALHLLAHLAAAEGDAARAWALYEESLHLRREDGDAATAGICLGDLGNLARAQGDAARARALWRESLGIARGRLGHGWLLSWSLGNVATLLAQEGDHAAAARLAGAAVAAHRFFPQSIDPDERADYRAALAAARAALGAEAFAARWEAGQALTPAEAVAEAERALGGA
jgi:predicted ATPase/transcriptional regulator with XRE-family HTH domain